MGFNSFMRRFNFKFKSFYHDKGFYHICLDIPLVKYAGMDSFPVVFLPRDLG